ncbi:MAG TPA: FliH/SctL family protein [Bryobacteraceae bacterium]|nr:FliH/SctL family protein [Bryobacteraceae bacterium]
MSALSKIVADPGQDVRPMVWRSSDGAQTPAIRQQRTASAPGSSGEDAETRMQEQVRQAFEAGFREGESGARQKMETEVRQAIERLAAAAHAVLSARSEAIRGAETEMVQLSIEIARRILHRELSVDPAAVAALIKAALEKLSGQEVFRLRVHPEQEHAIRGCLDRLPGGAGIEVAADPAQPRGGAVFETSRGLLDASIETQLQEIERGLTDQLQRRS